MLPRGWANISFEEVTAPDAPIIYGILQPGPEVSGGVPYVRPTEIKDEGIRLADIRRTSFEIAERYRRSTIRKGDLILSIVGTIGKVAEVPEELDGGNITQSSCRIRADRLLVEPEFLSAFLRSPTAIAQYDSKRLGTAVPRLNIADIRKFSLPLPPLVEQRRIIAKLSTINSRLASAKAELERVAVLRGSNTQERRLLDRLEAAILDRAFCGKLVPQDPADEPASVMLDRIRTKRSGSPKTKRARNR